MKHYILILSLCCLFSCQGVSHGETESSMAVANYKAEPTSYYNIDKKQNVLGLVGGSGTGKLEEVAVEIDQKIIRTAEVMMEVANYEKSMNQLEELLRKYKATIRNEAEKRWDTGIQNSITIQIAPEHLDDFILALDEIAMQVKNKNINARDVTRQYVDLETRLASKRAVVKRYTELLEVAQSVSDVLEVEEKLRFVIEEIESAEAQLRSLKGQVEQSTINLTLYETLRAPISKRSSFFKQIGNAFVDGWDYLKDFLLGLMSIWPFIFMGVGLVYLVRRERKRRRRNTEV